MSGVGGLRYGGDEGEGVQGGSLGAGGCGGVWGCGVRRAVG